jgi:hypothetical protein
VIPFENGAGLPAADSEHQAMGRVNLLKRRLSDQVATSFLVRIGAYSRGSVHDLDEVQAERYFDTEAGPRTTRLYHRPKESPPDEG